MRCRSACLASTLGRQDFSARELSLIQKPYGGSHGTNAKAHGLHGTGHDARPWRGQSSERIAANPKQKESGPQSPLSSVNSVLAFQLHLDKFEWFLAGAFWQVRKSVHV